MINYLLLFWIIYRIQTSHSYTTFSYAWSKERWNTNYLINNLLPILFVLEYSLSHFVKYLLSMSIFSVRSRPVSHLVAEAVILTVSEVIYIPFYLLQSPHCQTDGSKTAARRPPLCLRLHWHLKAAGLRRSRTWGRFWRGLLCFLKFPYFNVIIILLGFLK